MYCRLRSGVPACDTGRVTFQRIESVESKTFGSVFALRYLNLAALTLLHSYGDGGYHSLTGILVSSRLPMVEHIPLTVYLTDTAVSVAVNSGRCKYVVMLIGLTGTGIDNGSAICERSQRIVTVGVCQCIVRYRKTEFTVLGETAVYKYILILYLT